MRAVVDREIVVRFRIDDEEGRYVSADSTPTIAVVDGAGATVPGVSTVTEDPGGSGTYKATIPARDKLDTLTATLTAVVSSNQRKLREQITVIGSRLVEAGRLRESPLFDGAALLQLQRVQDTIETWFKRALGFPATPEPLRGRVRGPGGPRLLIPGAVHPLTIYEASQGSTALTAGELAMLVVEDGFVYWTDGRSWAPQDITYWMSHGFAYPPEDLVRAANAFAVYVTRKPDEKIPERATRVTTQDADFIFSLPDPSRPTGLPDVDTVIRGYRFEVAV